MFDPYNFKNNNNNKPYYSLPKHNAQFQLTEHSLTIVAVDHHK